MKRSDEAATTHLFRQIRWGDLDPDYLRRLILMARHEDLTGLGLKSRPPAEQWLDVTTAAAALKPSSTATIVARQPLRVCGLSLLPLILEVYGSEATATPVVEDGTAVEKGATLARISGTSSLLLQAERIILNFLQHLSGIATEAARYSAALAGSGTRLLDTRKTTPGYRMLEKYAVACGGGWNHRLGLFDRVMLKDNHLAASESTAGERLAAAVRAAREAQPKLVIEVEVDHLAQIPPVLEAGADVILLDNFPLDQLQEAVEQIGDRAYTEASGNVTVETLPALGNIGLDFVSCGAITHQSRWIDIALDWE